MNPKIKDIKRAQKESLLLREIKNLFLQIVQDNPELAALSIHRVQLSPDKSTCSVYFYSPEGKDLFHSLFEKLVLYKPSIRAALAQTISSRYVPELRFKFDKQFEKEKRILDLLDKLKEEDQS